VRRQASADHTVPPRRGAVKWAGLQCRRNGCCRLHQMECPTCRQELDQDGVCPNCSADPAVQDPPGDPTIRLTTVFSAGDPALIALAKSLLDSEEIDYVVRGEGVQDLFGWGRVGSGFNVITGPARFEVREEDGPRARELLRDLTAADSE
jgi:hypothetical protein